MDNIILNRPERRRFTRINCSLPINFIAKSGIGEADSDLREYNGWGRNISEGGIYIETPNLESRFLAHLNQSRCKIELKIYLFSSKDYILTQGEIIWIREEGGFGFSVQFVQINEYVKDRIRAYISKRLSARPGLEELEETKQSIRDITFPIKVDSSIIVKQPKEAVYNLLKNMECFPEFMENVKQVTLLEGRGDRTITEWEIDLDSTAIIWKQENIFDDRQMSIKFKMLEGDFGRYEGEWNLFGLLTGTEIRLTIVVDWGLSVLNKCMRLDLEKMLQEQVNGMLTALRKKMWVSKVLQLAKFACVIHPLDFGLVAKLDGNVSKKREIVLRKILERMPAFWTSYITGIKSLTGKEIEGEFIMCPLLPDQILNLDKNFVLERVIEAGKIAQERGAKILGLAAYTSNVGRKGILIANVLDIPVTTGTSYTIATVIEATLKAAKEIGIELHRAKAVIIGATGAIGSVCAQILSDKIASLTLVARNKERLNSFANFLRDNSVAIIKTSKIIDEFIFRDADIIISVTNTPTSLIDMKSLPSGIIVCDISLPRNISEEAAKLRKDILIIDGGIVEPPGDVNFNFYFGLPPGLCYACIAETMILALEERFESYSLGGNISLAKVNQIAQLGAKHGFKLAELRSFGSNISAEQIEEVRDSLIRRL